LTHAFNNQQRSLADDRRNIAIVLADLQKGKGMAHACVIA